MSVRLHRRRVLRLLRSRKQELLRQRTADVQRRGVVGLASRLWQHGLLQQCLRRRLCSRLHGMRGDDDDSPHLQRPGGLGKRDCHQRGVQRGLYSDYREELQRQHFADLQLVRNMANIWYELPVLLQHVHSSVRRTMQFRRPPVRERKYNTGVYEQPHMGQRAGLRDKSNLLR